MMAVIAKLTGADGEMAAAGVDAVRIADVALPPGPEAITWKS
jgi:hypothetical protein